MGREPERSPPIDPPAGPASARNTGARLARGRFLAFTDDDCMRTPIGCARSTGGRRRVGTLAIGGHTVNVLTDSVYSEASQGIIDYLYEYFGEHPPRRFFTSNNLVVPREDFVEIGGFDDTFALAAAEDRDFCERWLDAGKISSARGTWW